MPKGGFNPCAWAYRGRIYICGLYDGVSFGSQNILACRYDSSGDLQGPWEVVGQTPKRFWAAGVLCISTTGTLIVEGGQEIGFTPIVGTQLGKVGGDGSVSMRYAADVGRKAIYDLLAHDQGFLFSSGGAGDPASGHTSIFASKLESGIPGPYGPAQQAPGFMNNYDGSMAAKNGTLVVLCATASAGGPGATPPTAIFTSKIGADGSLGRWILLASVSSRIAATAVAVNSGVIFVGGYTSPDGNTFADLTETLFVSVDTDGRCGKPIQLASMKVPRDEATLVSDGRFVWAIGGETDLPGALKSIEVMDTGDLG